MTSDEDPAARSGAWRPQPAPVDIAAESVAGEEDPGASLDVDDAVAPAPPPTAGSQLQPGAMDPSS